MDIRNVFLQTLSAGRTVPIPAILDGHLTLPVIGSPMFIVSNPELVIAQCKAGIVDPFSALRARPKEQLALWLERITTEFAAYKAAHPHKRVAPFAVNQIVHASNNRLMHDMETCVRFKVPIGAIANGASVLAAPAICADLTYMGTRFIAVKEAKASDAYKQMIIKSAAEDIVYTALLWAVSIAAVEAATHAWLPPW